MTGIHVGEITTGGMQKNARIAAGLKMLLSGKIILHERVRSAVLYQITQWNPLKTKNKDELLDLVAYAHAVMELHSEYLPLLISDRTEDTMPEGSTAETLALPF